LSELWFHILLSCREIFMYTHFGLWCLSSSFITSSKYCLASSSERFGCTPVSVIILSEYSLTSFATLPSSRALICDLPILSNSLSSLAAVLRIDFRSSTSSEIEIADEYNPTKKTYDANPNVAHVALPNGGYGINRILAIMAVLTGQYRNQLYPDNQQQSSV
jgi:hypothetical protein